MWPHWWNSLPSSTLQSSKQLWPHFLESSRANLAWPSLPHSAHTLWPCESQPKRRSFILQKKMGQLLETFPQNSALQPFSVSYCHIQQLSFRELTFNLFSYMHAVLKFYDLRVGMHHLVWLPLYFISLSFLWSASIYWRCPRFLPLIGLTYGFPKLRAINKISKWILFFFPFPSPSRSQWTVMLWSRCVLF